MKIVLDDGAFMPEYAHNTDSGMDLRTPVDVELLACTVSLINDVFRISGGSATVDTGIHIPIPAGHTGFIKSKSGLNVNHDIVVEGVIDEGYTGSIVVKMYNRGIYDYKFKAGDKIAQLVILPVMHPEEMKEVNSLPETERGENGFGSTGR